MATAGSARHILWRAATSFSSAMGRSSGSVFQGPLVHPACVQWPQTCGPTSIRPHSVLSAARGSFECPSSARPLQGSFVQPTHISSSPVACRHLISRGYKIITSAIVDLPNKIIMKGGPTPKTLKQNSRSVTESCNRITRWLHEARMPEGWRQQKFYIKPKYRRNEKRWAGVLKRKRRDFNYKLRWALKSMTR